VTVANPVLPAASRAEAGAPGVSLTTASPSGAAVASPTLTVVAPGTDTPRWYRRWYVWAGVGAVVIAAVAAGAAAGASSSASGPASGLPQLGAHGYFGGH
jgi:hypothetical protein